MTTINPYLTFDDNTEEAFELYRSVFGWEFAMIMRFKDMPPEYPPQAGEEDKIMHISLPIGWGTVLMGSDSPASMGKVVQGNNFAISISVESQEEADRIFHDLSEGGRVTMALEKAFWGSYFGMLTDKFGIQWMVSYDLKQ